MKKNRNILDECFSVIEEEIFDSMKHFNKKYYFAGFLDALLSPIFSVHL